MVCRSLHIQTDCDIKLAFWCIITDLPHAPNPALVAAMRTKASKPASHWRQWHWESSGLQPRRQPFLLNKPPTVGETLSARHCQSPTQPAINISKGGASQSIVSGGITWSLGIAFALFGFNTGPLPASLCPFNCWTALQCKESSVGGRGGGRSMLP